MMGLFVTGTDTDVGKTAVSCALIRHVRSAGTPIRGLKPVESGCKAGNGALFAADADALRKAGEDTSDNCLIRFELPLAPAVASSKAGVAAPELDTLVAWVQSQAAHSPVLVEGAGGWLVPLGTDTMMADLACALALPVLVVCRPTLGTINHSLLTLSRIAHDGCELAGFVISEVQPTEAGTREQNVTEILNGAARLGTPVDHWGTLHHGAPGARRLELTSVADNWLSARFGRGV